MKIKIDNLFFIGLFLLELSTIFVNVVFLQNYLNKIKLISIFLLTFCSFIKIFTIRANRKSWLFLLSLLAIGFISYFVTSRFLILELILIIVASLNIDFEDIICGNLKINLFLFVTLVLLYFIGATNGMIIHRETGLLRYSFGFYHPNLFSMYLVIMYFQYIYINRQNINLGKILIGVLITIIISVFADSKTACFILILFLSFILLKNISFKIVSNRLIYFLSKNGFLILTIICIIITMLFISNNSMAYKLNELFSSRIYIQSLYLQEYSINLLGNDINYFNSLDNAYIKIILNFGLVGCFLYNYLYSKIIKMSYEKKDYIIYFIYVIFIIYGMMENLMFDITFNIFWLYISKQLIRGE